MNLLQDLWRDESGVVLSAEAALLGTVGVLGAVVGLGAVGTAVNDELKETAFAFRSLDQSYHIRGQAGCGAWTAESGYVQPPVEESIAALSAQIEAEEQLQEEQSAKPEDDKDKKKVDSKKSDAKKKKEQAKKKAEAKKKAKKKERKDRNDA